MIHGIRPNDTAKNLVHNGKMTDFQTEFGDTYVQGMMTGGAYYAVMEFIATSDEQQQKIGASLDFSYLTFSGSANFKDQIQRMTQNTSLMISSLQIGGSDPGMKVGITLDEILNKVDSFPAQILQGGVPIQAFIQDYKALDFPDPPNFIDIENRQLTLMQYYRLRNVLVQKLNDLIYITQEHPEQFEDVDKYNLPDALHKVQGWLDAITRSASNCANAIQDCSFQMPVMDIITFPPRKKVANWPLMNIAQAVKVTVHDTVHNKNYDLIPKFLQVEPLDWMYIQSDRPRVIYKYVVDNGDPINEIICAIAAIVNVNEEPNPTINSCYLDFGKVVPYPMTVRIGSESVELDKPHMLTDLNFMGDGYIAGYFKQ
jgi:hypothetical protein